MNHALYMYGNSRNTFPCTCIHLIMWAYVVCVHLYTTCLTLLNLWYYIVTADKWTGWQEWKSFMSLLFSNRTETKLCKDENIISFSTSTLTCQRRILLKSLGSNEDIHTNFKICDICTQTPFLILISNFFTSTKYNKNQNHRKSEE